MVSPFLGTDISTGKILEVISNKKQSGGQVYKENDTAIRKSADIAGHLALGLAPGAVNNAWRIGMAAGDVKRSTGKPYSLSDEMRRQVVQILLLAGISKRNVGFLLREQVPPVNLSDRSFESAVKRAQLIMDNESAREVRSRFNRIVTP